MKGRTVTGQDEREVLRTAYEELENIIDRLQPIAERRQPPRTIRIHMTAEAVAALQNAVVELRRAEHALGSAQA
jgi:hypothetical protein